MTDLHEAETRTDLMRYETATHNLTHAVRYRRPDATGEMPRFVEPPLGLLAADMAPAKYHPAYGSVVETLVLPPNAQVVPLRRPTSTTYGLQDPPTGNPPPLPPQPAPKPGLLRLFRSARPLPPLRPAAPGQPRPAPQPKPQNPRPNPAPPPANWRPMHRRPAPMWAYATASAGLTMVVFASGWVSCWAVAL